ncbi:TetR/AcrR family transcriptional regulator [Nonomuraea muscovyensis]|uniref:TetR/AcrR family transcriptional regulator n=1 Tax=Nonomuraea muscovyensis TaxID=1124761 RepID=UPI001622B2B2|nr:TetR/AcrR family transcriptional regulator [Nonomuraea muscovyensis]
MTSGFSRLRREDLLKAACEVIAERGFGHTRTLDIARAAGVSQALLFYHFETKEQLFAQAFAYAAQIHRTALESIERLERPPLDRLRTLLRRCSPGAAPDGWRLWIDAWAESIRSHDLEQISRRLDQQGRLLMRSIIDDGVRTGDFACADPEASSWRIFALIDGLAIQIHVHPQALSRRRADQLVRTAAAAEVGVRPADL